ncbi:MAG: hypothetical protein ACLU9X_00245 [Alistipes shahii]
MLTEQFIQNTRQTITGCRQLPLGRRLYGHQTGVRPGFVERIAGFDPVMDGAAAAGVPVGGACRQQRRTARIQSARHSRRSNGGEQGKRFFASGLFPSDKYRQYIRVVQQPAAEKDESTAFQRRRRFGRSQNAAKKRPHPVWDAALTAGTDG